jgi:ubiquinone/menaquinone biosynthesis C-methylase UbiE
MNVTDAVAFAGHQVHVCRYREAGTLLRWLGSDLRGKRVLDVAGGDGYWAGQARRRGAFAVNIDIAGHKLVRGAHLANAPAQVLGDALKLPFPDGSFDRVLSICAIEHFDDGPQALSEIARVLAPGGELVMSADTLSRKSRWPSLFEAHSQRYHVQRTYTHGQLTELLDARGLDVEEYTYQFRSDWSERLYLTLSAHGGKVGFNAAAPLAPLVAASDRLTHRDQGAIVLIRARRRPDRAEETTANEPASSAAST